MSTHEAVKKAERMMITAVAKSMKEGSTIVHFTQDEADEILRVLVISGKYTQALKSDV